MSNYETPEAGARWNADFGAFTFDGKRWEDLEPGDDRVYGYRDAVRVYEASGARAEVSNELHRIWDTLNPVERVNLEADSLAEQGFDGQADLAAAQKKEFELDMRQQVADEMRQQHYYAGLEESHDVSWFLQPAAHSQRLNDKLEANTAQVAAWSPSPQQARVAGSQGEGEGEIQEHTYRRSQRL